MTMEQVEAIRVATRVWRRDAGLSGPKPDGQLEQTIEVMLGTLARIGEVLAIRKRDVDVTVSPAKCASAGQSCRRRVSPLIASTTPRP
jgi:hypothetical protein